MASSNLSASYASNAEAHTSSSALRDILLVSFRCAVKPWRVVGWEGLGMRTGARQRLSVLVQAEERVIEYKGQRTKESKRE